MRATAWRPDAGKRFDGTDEHRIRLTIHQGWARSADPRAESALVDAHAALMADAHAISDAGLRRSFLANIPERREIVALMTGWHLRGGAGVSAG